jgi:hypothetical protein
MLRGDERGVGTCTDVALYVIHAGARIVPLQPPAAPYHASACGARTARMLLETMYGEAMGGGGAAPRMMLVNSEHMWEADAGHHAAMDAFLCKTRFCAALLKAHVKARGWRGEVRLMGHASSDPTADLPAGVQRDEVGSLSGWVAFGWLVGWLVHPHTSRQPTLKEGTLHARPPPRHPPPRQAPGFLHVKGKSGLKHTRQLLECWGGRPDLPMLHVVGRFTWDEVEGVAAAKNIRLYPNVGLGGVLWVGVGWCEGAWGLRLACTPTHHAKRTAPSPSNEINRQNQVTAAADKEQTQHIGFQDIRNLQARIPVHVCTSEREGAAALAAGGRQGCSAAGLP